MSSAKLRIVPTSMALFSVVYLAASMGLTAVLFADERGLYPSPGLFIVSWLALYAVTVVLVVVGFGGVRRSALVPVSLCGIAILSGLWSPAPSTTLKYGVSLAFNVLFCSWLSSRYTIPQVMRLALLAIVGMVSVSLLLWLGGADLVRYIDPHGRPNILGGEPVRGLFNHKITAGLYACIGLLLVLSVKPRFVSFVVGGVLLSFLLLTGSASAVALLVASIGVLAMVRLGRKARLKPRRFMGALLSVFVGAAVVALLLKDPVLDLLGRDATLTGRTLLWSWGLGAISIKPFLGWGYQGYFESSDAYLNLISFIEFTNYDVPHFHNAYIQTAVDLGVPAVIAYVWMMALAARLNYAACLVGDSIEHEIAVSLLALVLLAGLFMNVFLVYNNFPTVLVVTVFLQCRRLEALRRKPGCINEGALQSYGRGVQNA
jgi:exopolysaccharide production protein ExoQ